MFGIPGGAILPTYDAIARGTTVRHVLARHEQGAGHMARGLRARLRQRRRRDRDLRPRRDEPRHADRRRLDGLDAARLHHRPGALAPDRHRRLPGDRHRPGITMPIVKHSWLVQDVEELPHVIKAAFHVARTGRPGPVLVDIAKDVQEAEFDFDYPDEVDLPGWKPPRTVARAADRARPRGDRRGRAADPLRRRRRPQRRRVAPSCSSSPSPARLPAVDDADGEGRAPRLAPAELRLARHARLEVRRTGR